MPRRGERVTPVESLTFHLIAAQTAKTAGNLGNAFLHAEEARKIAWW
jgi:hypothetical protein